MSTLDTRTMNALTASLMVEELIRNGVDRFCLAPGSRCTPLTLAVARNPRARIFKHYDERGLGFFALGLARGDGQPAVVITTSGTAVANLLPAVVEADQEDLPLIVFSADRPPELRDTEANQTIDQVKIFGDRVRWFVDLPCPHIQSGPGFWLHSMDHAASMARSGPVHLNAMYREPLMPDDQGPRLEPWMTELGDWKDSDVPYTRYAPSERAVMDSTAKGLAESLKTCRAGVIVVGRLTSDADRQSAVTLAEMLGWPLVADMCSGLRQGLTSLQLIHGMDLILQHDAAMSDSPDAVIHLGGRLTSKRVQEWINRRALAVYVLCNDSVHQQVPGVVTDRAVGSVRYFCEDLARDMQPSSDPTWLTRWLERQGTCESVLSEQLTTVLNEPVLARSITRLIPKGHHLFVGNSMPIRDVEMFAAPECQAASFHANRGASGIDGLVATACGIGASVGEPLTLVLGDLSLLHDLNSLNLLRNSPAPVTLIVINNDGGGIFSFLPVAGVEDVFEEYFGTPHGLQFEHVAAQFGLAYAQANTLQSFEEAYAEAMEGSSSYVIEVTTQRDLNWSDHQAIRDLLLERLDA